MSELIQKPDPEKVFKKWPEPIILAYNPEYDGYVVYVHGQLILNEKGEPSVWQEWELNNQFIRTMKRLSGIDFTIRRG